MCHVTGLESPVKNTIDKLQHECAVAMRCDQGPGQDTIRELENSLNTFLQKSFAERDLFQQTRWQEKF